MNETTVTIAGLHMEVGDALRQHCAAKVEDMKAQHFEHITDISISFRNERHRNLAEVNSHANGIHLHAEGEGNDFYLAIDDALSTLGRRLEKYKGRMNKHRNRRAKMKEMEALPTMTATYHMVEEESLEQAPEDMFAEYMPKIKHKKIDNIETMSVDEAVMQMDLLHKKFFLFRHPKSGRLNVVYREEEDGPVGWIEPQD